MRCKHCNSQIENSDLYCPKCRKKTQIIKNTFLIREIIGSNFNKLKENKPDAKFSLFYTIIMIVFLGALYSHFFHFNYSNDWIRYGVENLIYLVMMPLLLVPFGIQNELMEIGYGSEFRNLYLSKLPRYFKFVLFNILVFALIKFLCIGDPILVIVRLILNLWWLAVQLPLAVIAGRDKRNCFKLTKLSNIAFQDLRWQMFFAIGILLFANIVMIIPLFLGFIFYGQLSAKSISEFVDRVYDNGIIEKYFPKS